MIRRMLRVAALAILCALLAFAPEILTYIDGPYYVSAEPRALLRIALATDDAAAARAFYARLNDVRKRFPSWHFRVQRVDAARLFALPEPLPDVFIFPASRSFADMGLAPQGLLIPLASSGEAGAADVPQSKNDAADSARPGESAAFTEEKDAADSARPGESAAFTKENDAADSARPGESAAFTEEKDAADSARPGESAAFTKENDAADSVRPGGYIMEETAETGGIHRGVRYALPIPAEGGEALLAAACARSQRVADALALLYALTSSP